MSGGVTSSIRQKRKTKGIVRHQNKMKKDVVLPRPIPFYTKDFKKLTKQ